MTDELRITEAKAFAAQKAGDYNDAARLWLDLICRAPCWEFGYLYYNLANCYVRLARLDEAEQAYKRAISVAPEDQMFSEALQSLLQARDADKRKMLRVKTSFQDTPGDDFYFVLRYRGRPLSEQLEELGLRNFDKVILWEEDCGDVEIEATLLFDHEHPMMFGPALWAKAEKRP